MKDFDEMAQWAIARLTEQRMGEEIISHSDLDKIIETLDFSRLHCGSLELINAHLRDWVGCGEGMMVVPIRVTGNMLKAGIDAQREGKLIPELWSDMLDAAPGNPHAPM